MYERNSLKDRNPTPLPPAEMLLVNEQNVYLSAENEYRKNDFLKQSVAPPKRKCLNSLKTHMSVKECLSAVHQVMHTCQGPCARFDEIFTNKMDESESQLGYFRQDGVNCCTYTFDIIGILGDNVISKGPPKAMKLFTSPSLVFCGTYLKANVYVNK